MTSVTEDHKEEEEDDRHEEIKEAPALNQAVAEVDNQDEIIIDTRPKKKAEPTRFVSPIMRPRPRNDAKSRVLVLLCNPEFNDVYDWDELCEREIPDEEDFVGIVHIDLVCRTFEFQAERAKNFGKPIN
jgi:hypothetical protein